MLCQLTLGRCVHRVLPRLRLQARPATATASTGKMLIRTHAPAAALLPLASLRINVRWASSPTAKKQPVVLREEDLEESFVKGSGKGGQKINKVRNCVLLKHTPTGLLVRCQKTRSLDDNRRVARKLLLQKLDDALNGELSARSVKINKLRRRKANKRAKSKHKYGAAAAAADETEGETDSASDSSDDDEFDDDDDDDDSDVHEDAKQRTRE